jgi:hypothetical protein
MRLCLPASASMTAVPPTDPQAARRPGFASDSPQDRRPRLRLAGQRPPSPRCSVRAGPGRQGRWPRQARPTYPSERRVHACTGAGQQHTVFDQRGRDRTRGSRSAPAWRGALTSLIGQSVNAGVPAGRPPAGSSDGTAGPRLGLVPGPAHATAARQPDGAGGTSRSRGRRWGRRALLLRRPTRPHSGPATGRRTSAGRR